MLVIALHVSAGAQHLLRDSFLAAQVGRGLHHGDVSMRGASENGNVHHATAGSNHRQQSHSAEAASQGERPAGTPPLGSEPDEEEGWEGEDELDVALQTGNESEARTDENASKEEDPASAADSGWEGEDPLDLEPLTGLNAQEAKPSSKDTPMQQPTAGLGQAEAVPLHGCWAALLKHMLQDGSSVLVASVLRTVEDAAARQPFLITPAEAHTLTEAASCAGQEATKSWLPCQ